jgi:hypothetical protein
VPDLISPAASGRAKCRGCGRNIANGSLRFGEAAPNPYAGGETHVWFHLSCAALMRPDKFLPVLKASSDIHEDRAWLEQTASFGIEHPRLPRLLRAERASSGRATCRSCRELIAKGDWRFSLQMFEEGRPTPIGNIHAGCADAYFGVVESVLERATRLAPGLEESELNDLRRALAQQRPGLAKAGAAEADAARTGSDEE